MGKCYFKLMIRTLFLSIVLFFALIISSFGIGNSIQRFKKEDRYIAVKGFAEREVKADLALWLIQSRIATNDLASGLQQIDSNKAKILDFLGSHGLNGDEVVVHNTNVTDKMARDYLTENTPLRYILENAVQVRTDKVDTLLFVSRQTDKLLQAGVLISASHDYNPAVKFMYSGLNDIKPAMLSEATQNARTAALEFAKESGVSLGKLRKANQGLFSIVDRDYSIMAPNAGAYSPSTNDIFKNVRVVVNVEYSVE